MWFGPLFLRCRKMGDAGAREAILQARLAQVCRERDAVQKQISELTAELYAKDDTILQLTLNLSSCEAKLAAATSSKTGEVGVGSSRRLFGRPLCLALPYLLLRAWLLLAGAAPGSRLRVLTAARAAFPILATLQGAPGSTVAAPAPRMR